MSWLEYYSKNPADDEVLLKTTTIVNAWYKTIRRDGTDSKKGSAYFLAIAILANVLEVGGCFEQSQKTLQFNYAYYAEMFGVSKRQVKTAIDFLVNKNLLHREFRTTKIEDFDILIPNVMFLKANLPEIEKVSEVILS